MTALVKHAMGSWDLSLKLNITSTERYTNVSYGNIDITNEEEEFSLSDSELMNLPAKSAALGYCLATNKYMLAKRHGMIQGPTTRTRAMKIA